MKHVWGRSPCVSSLGLTLEGTPLAAHLVEFKAEMRAAGLAHVRPRFYLSTEWGVPFKTVAIAIPFYLVRPDLTAHHAHRTGLVEGADRNDILRYLRHELGHVVNYAYELYERPDWIELFGAITQPYTRALSAPALEHPFRAALHGRSFSRLLLLGPRRRQSRCSLRAG